MDDVTGDKVSVYAEIYEKMCETMAREMLMELKNKGVDAVVQKKKQNFKDGLVVMASHGLNMYIDAEGHSLNGMPFVLFTSVNTSETKGEKHKSSSIRFRLLIDYDVAEDAQFKTDPEMLENVLAD